MSVTPGGDGEQRLQAELTYAWSWFQYHAQQRLTAFNFCLMLDVRNEELVDCGREALQKIEQHITARPSHEAGRRTHLAQTGWIGTVAAGGKDRRRRWVSHSRWLRIIEATVSGVFLIAAAWGATGFSGA